MFVLLFSVVFGGAINVGAEGGESASYTNFLMAGIFVQTVAFAGIYTSVLLANDLQKGMIDRFRSLPMAQSSVLTGRTLTDLLRAALAVAIMWVVGLVVGFRPEGGLAANSLAIGIMLLFGFALSWVGVAAGAAVRTPEALQGIIFAVVFPLTFVSSAFVPIDTLPEWLQPFAENQPFTRGGQRRARPDAGNRPLPRHGAGHPVVGRHPLGRVPARDLALQPPHDAVAASRGPSPPAPAPTARSGCPPGRSPTRSGRCRPWPGPRRRRRRRRLAAGRASRRGRAPGS